MKCMIKVIVEIRRWLFFLIFLCWNALEYIIVKPIPNDNNVIFNNKEKNAITLLFI